jgi:hypothetical protein
MGLAIILRKQVMPNHFRDLLLAAVNSGAGRNALMCSGFFQELYRGDPYRASMEQGFGQVLASRRIRLTTIGIHNNYWLPSYRNFARNLRRLRVNLKALYVVKLRWHAKVFILATARRPLFGIVGSSNVTQPAFSTSKRFNKEADVVLWDTQSKRIAMAVESVLERIADPHEVVRAEYCMTLNGGLSEVERLKRLEKEIRSMSLRELEF